jgi:hypothetical protein
MVARSKVGRASLGSLGIMLGLGLTGDPCIKPPMAPSCPINGPRTLSGRIVRYRRARLSKIEGGCELPSECPIKQNVNTPSCETPSTLSSLCSEINLVCTSSSCATLGIEPILFFSVSLSPTLLLLHHLLLLLTFLCF